MHITTNPPVSPYADLHMHSVFSDGTLSPAQLVARAHSIGLQVIALTDHDTVAGLADLRVAAHSAGLETINGVELSCYWVYKKGTQDKQMLLHVVALGFEIDSPLVAKLAELQHARSTRAKQIAELLAKRTGKNPWLAVVAMAQGNEEAISRSHFAQWLLDEKLVSTPQQAFDRFLAEGKSAYVPMTGLALEEAVALIRQSNGKSVIAHPAKYNVSATLLRELVAAFATMGGDGIELPHINTPSGTKDMLHRLIRTHNLMASTASDFHGDHMPWCKLGSLPPVPQGVAHIITHLR